jgi:hypothetical protein
MLRHYVNKFNLNIKMTFIYNKQHGLFSSNRSYLHNGQGSLNEFKKAYKPFGFIKSSLYHDNIFIFYHLLQCQ